MAKNKTLTPEKQYRSGYIDLTKTGPLSYRELRNLNNNLPQESSANQALDFSGIQGFRNPGAYYTLSNDFGQSIYDPEVASAAEFENYLDVRAENLPWYAKIGAGIGKGITTAGTTFVDGTLGLITGIGEGLGYTFNQWANGEKADAAYGWSRLFDNPVSNTMREINNLMESILPNYRTKEEEENEWYQNMGTANFWSDFIKQIGFTVGAFYSGATWTKGLKALSLVNKAGSGSMLGATLSAVNEGRIEANNNSNDWANLQNAQLEDKYRDLFNLINAEPDLLIITGDGHAVSLKLLRLRELLLNLQKEKEDIEHRKLLMGLTDLALNVPILMYDNMMTFGKLYARGFASAKKASGKQVGKSYMLRLQEGFTEAAKKNADAEAGKLVLKDGSKYIWKDITAKQAAGKGLRNFLREGNEEMAQTAASEFSGNWFNYDSPDAYYKALTDPDSEQKTKNFVTSLTEGFANSYGDLSNYLDFFMGGLTGLLGTPTFGKSLNSSASTWTPKGKIVGMSGGILGEFGEKAALNKAGREAVAGMNDYIEKYNQGLAGRARHLVADNSFTDAMNGWAANNDHFEYANASDNATFNAIDNFAQVGKLDDFKALVSQDFDNISDDDLDKIATETIDLLTGKPLWANADGTLMSSTELGREQMRKELSLKRDSILDGIDKYEEYLGLMRSNSKIEDNNDAIRELAWLRWKINRFAQRKDLLSELSKDLLTKINSSLATTNNGLQVAIGELGKTSDTNKLHAELLKDSEAKLKENLTIQKTLLNWIGKTGGLHRLTDEGKKLLLSEDFYEDLTTNTGMSYDEYLTAMSNILDLDRIDDLAKEFNDRLKYYLDESKPTKSKTLDKSIPAEGDVLVDDNTPAPNSAEEKINVGHAEVDLANEERQDLNNATALQQQVDTIQTANDYHSLIGEEGENKEAIDAVIKDLPEDHPARQALKIELTIDRIQDALLSDAINVNIAKNLWSNVKDAAANSHSFDEFKNQLLDDNNIGLAVGVRPLDNKTPQLLLTITSIKLAISDLFNKLDDDTTLSSTLANNNEHTISEESESTGSDNNTKNAPINSISATQGITDLQLYDKIASYKQLGVGDNLIIDTFKSQGYDELLIKHHLDLYNDSQRPITEEETAVVHTYEHEADTYTQAGDVETLVPIDNLEENELPKTKEGQYNYLRFNTTEVPIHATLEERDETFNFDTWVGSLSYSGLLKRTLKVRHKRLLLSGAYNRVNLGELNDSKSNNPTEVKFLVIKEDNKAARDFIIYMTDDKGNIIGDLPTNANSYNGLNQLILDIKDRYEKAGSPDTYMDTVTTHVDKIMLGRPQFTNTLLTIGEINPNLTIGICTNSSLGTIETAPKGSNSSIPQYEILSPLEPKAGQVYVLLPNGRKGGAQGYTPVLCTVPRVGEAIEGTQIALKIKDALTELSTSTTWGLLMTAIGHLDDYVYIPDIMINAYSNGNLVRPKSNDPITSLVFKDRIDGHLNPNSRLNKLGTINIGNPNALAQLMNLLSTYRGQGAPLNIRVKELNTPTGRLMYNEVVMTNLPKNTETTIGNWFTTNPIVKGKEQSAESPRSTYINPNKADKTPETVNNTREYPHQGKTIIADPDNNCIIIEGQKTYALDVKDPNHLVNFANRVLAYDFVQTHPLAAVTNDMVQTPYGSFNIKTNELGRLVLKGFNREQSVSKGETPDVKSLGSTVNPTYSSSDKMEDHMVIESSARGKGSETIVGNKSSEFDSREYSGDLRSKPGFRVVNIGENKTAIIWSTKSSIAARGGTSGVLFDRRITKEEADSVIEVIKEVTSDRYSTFSNLAEDIWYTLTCPLGSEHGEVKKVNNLNVLGQAEIRGRMLTIKKSTLRRALTFGFGTTLTANSPFEEIVKAIQDFFNAFDRRATTSESYVQFDKEKELAWLDRVLPQLSQEDRVQLVDGLIENRAWGMFSKGIMYLSNEAARGTTYHEAFHVVSLTLLSNKDRERLYTTASKVYGLKPIAELEEALAEDFRRYTQLDETPDSKLGKFFRRLWNNIKALVSNRAKLEKLFYDINLGIYANKAQDLKASNTLYRLAGASEKLLNAIANNKLIGLVIYDNKDLAIEAIMTIENDVTHRLNTKRSYMSGILWAKRNDNDKYSIEVNSTNLDKLLLTAKPSLKNLSMNITDNAVSNLERYKDYDFNRLDAETLMHYMNNGIDEQYWLNNISLAEKELAFRCQGV